MIDMNGSIESIMEECDRIAFNETKSQADLALRQGRERSRGEYGHFNQEYNRGEKIQKGQKSYYGPSYRDPKGAEEAHKAVQPMKTADDYRRREKMYGRDLKVDRDQDKYHDRHRARTGEGHPINNTIARRASVKEKERAREYKARDNATNEGVSIFDTLLDLV